MDVVDEVLFFTRDILQYMQSGMPERSPQYTEIHSIADIRKRQRSQSIRDETEVKKCFQISSSQTQEL